MTDTEERLAELSAAYDTLVAFNLWRRGKIEAKDAADPKEIGEAIDTAAGVLWEVMRQKDEKTLTEMSLKSCESANEYLKKELEKAESERDQARKELAALWEQCRDTLAEDDHADPTM